MRSRCATTRAGALGLRTLSELARHPGLKLGLSQEFIGRGDGWPGLKAAYRMPYATPSGLDHGLAYEAIAAGRIDVMDVYTTDAKIERYKLRVLEDDRAFFRATTRCSSIGSTCRSVFRKRGARSKRLEGRSTSAA